MRRSLLPDILQYSILLVNIRQSIPELTLNEDTLMVMVNNTSGNHRTKPSCSVEECEEGFLLSRVRRCERDDWKGMDGRTYSALTKLTVITHLFLGSHDRCKRNRRRA